MRTLWSSVLLVLAWLLPAGVLVQAVLAGRAWFVAPELFELHGGVGHGVLLLSVITAGLAWAHRNGRRAAVLATVVVLALVVQTGLGYAGRRSQVVEASVWHIPLGVTVLGLTVAVAVLLSVQRPSPDAETAPR